jgi:hypothetical protein
MSYSSIKEAFKKVLKHSPTIKGRFYLLPKYMAEINGADLEQCISTAKIPKLKDGPLVAMMPPVAFGSYRSGEVTWTRYVCVLYFLRTSFVDENGNTRDPSPSGATRVKLETDWDVMKSVAGDTLRVMDKYFSDALNGDIPMVATIRFKARSEHTISPVSLQGNERWSGVKVVCQIELNEGCEVAEYSPEAIADILSL